MVRKQSDPLDDFANLLVRVPGGGDGPGGVLVCSEGLITYRNVGEQAPVAVRIPQRADVFEDRSRGVIINCHATHKTRQMMFFLLQVGVVVSHY